MCRVGIEWSAITKIYSIIAPKKTTDRRSFAMHWFRVASLSSHNCATDEQLFLKAQGCPKSIRTVHLTLFFQIQNEFENFVQPVQ